MFLRRSGLTEEQKSLVMTQVGKDLEFERIITVMQKTFGQNSVMIGGRGNRTYYEEDVPGEYYDSHDWTDGYFGEESHEEYWQDPQDEWLDDPEDDWQEWEDEDAYYETADSSEPLAQTQAEIEAMIDEYDDAYSNYTAARNKMNEVKRSRGFFPVVALTPGGKGYPVVAQSKGYPSSKGKGRGKTKGKNKGQEKR